MILFMTIFLSLLHLFFYFYDSALLSSAARESAVVGAQQGRIRQADSAHVENTAKELFQKRTGGQLIWFRSPSISVSVTAEKLLVTVSASRGPTRFHTKGVAYILHPEDKIRYEVIIQNTERSIEQ